MRRIILRTSLMALTVLLASSGVQPHHSHAQNTIATAIPQHAYARVSESYGQLPMHFEANQGQFDDRVDFLTRGSGYTLFLTGSEAVFSLRAPVESTPTRGLLPAPDDLEADHAATYTTLRMQVVGGSPNPQVRGAERLPGIINYFVGNDPDQWVTDIPTYSVVDYAEVYPGIDLRYYGNQVGLQYDFIISPGADPSVIRLQFQHAESIELDTSGDLLLGLPGGVLRQHAPFTYQDLNGERVEVGSRFALLDGGQVGFAVGAYDRSRPLVIDPELVYSTYLGGSGDDYGEGIAVDGSGAAYVTGETASTNFPTQSAYQASSAGNKDIFVTKLNAAGSSLVYSTYLGGSGWDSSLGIAVDSSGAAYATGWTLSTDFPTQNPYQATNQGTCDAFVTKLASDGSSLVYSTYLGGSGGEEGYGIAVDSSGAAYLTGSTGSTNFPTQNPYQATNQGSWDAFVTKLNASGSALAYSTYLGGSSDDWGFGIAVDSSGAAYATGYTGSTDFPTQNPYQATNQGSYDAFVTKLAPGGSSLVYSTYLGGSNAEYSYGIAVDSGGTAYITGYTQSTNFPTQNPYQASYGGGEDAFVTRLSANGSALVYSTYLGGSGNDWSAGIKVDSSGAAYITGSTGSTDFPTHNPYQANHAGGGTDAFVTRLEPGGSALVYSTYLGGSGSDEGRGIAVDSSGAAYVTGYTQSTNFPTQTPYQASFAGGYTDAFVAKLDSVIPVLLSPDDRSYTSDTTPLFDWTDVSGAIRYQVQVDNNASFVSPVFTANTVASQRVSPVELPDGKYYWRVRARDAEGNWDPWSNVWWFRVDTTPPSRPVLQSPAHLAQTNDNTPFFNWADSSGSPYRYQIQADDDVNFSSPAFTVNTSVSKRVSPVVLADGWYFWRVRARDKVGNWSAWSNRWRFRIDTNPPTVPVLELPNDNGTVHDSRPYFHWSDSLGQPYSYQLQVDNNATFASPVFTSGTLVSEFRSTVSLPNGAYYWRVRARDKAGNWSAWTAKRKFTVQVTTASAVLINEVQIAGPDAVELLNATGEAYDLSGWQVLNYDERGRLYASYTFPDGFTLEPGAYVTVHESAGRDTPSDLYTGANLWWEPEAGAVALVDGTIGVDFVRWGGSLVEPAASGNAWSGSNPLGPRISQTLGRALNSIDSDRGQDWCRQAPSFGTQNGGCLEPAAIPDGVPADGCFEEVHPLWTLHGDWQPRSSDTASSGEYLVYTFGQTNPDAYAEFRFAGEGFALVYHKSPFGGFANVYVDDLRVPYAQLDMYAASETWQREAVFTVSGLDPTVEHVLRVAPTGRKNVRSRGYAIYIDRVDLPVFNAYREGGCFFIREEDLPQ